MSVEFRESVTDELAEVVREAIAYWFNAGDEQTGPAIRARAALKRYNAERMKSAAILTDDEIRALNL